MVYKIPHEYEYTIQERHRIEIAFNKIYKSDGAKINWLYADDPNNVVKKVDATIIVQSTPNRSANVQLKKTKYEYTFTVGVSAMHAYLNETLPLNLLIVVQFKYDEMFIYDWDTFVETAHEKLNSWKLGNVGDSYFYIVPIDDIEMLTKRPL